MILKTPEELAVMDRANAVVHETLRLVAEAAQARGVDPGARSSWPRSTSDRPGARPAFKGYRGYPATLCISVNDVIVHGIPSSTHRLREGDILSRRLRRRCSTGSSAIRR